MNYSLNGNYIDLIILVILAYFVSEAWRYGFWIIIADFISFLLSMLLALWGYPYVADLFKSNFNLSHSISNAIGFFVTFGIAQSSLSLITTKVIKRIPYKFWKKPWNNLAAIIPSLGQGIILVSFALTLIMGFPIVPRVKVDISQSKIGSYLVSKTAIYESKAKEIFGGLAEESLTYLTSKEGGEGTVLLDCPVISLTIDAISEEQMLALVNEERSKVGVANLKLRPVVVPVAENYARDLWERQYFSHYSPEGEDVGDRLTEANIEFVAAGENLALAPTLQTAHTGLMNSPGHRKNILDPEFKQVGIGAIDNGYCGKMFVQVFTD